MKKLILALCALFVSVSVANATNVMNGDPLYRPSEGTFASQTSLFTGNGAGWNKSIFKGYSLTEDFSYGVTDDFAVGVDVTGSYNTKFTADDEYSFDPNRHQISFDEFNVNASYRFLDVCCVEADVLGSVGRKFFTDNGLHSYGTDWMAGLRAGVVLKDFTVAGYAKVHDFVANGLLTDATALETNYWYAVTGVEGKYNINETIAAVAGAEYKVDLGDYSYIDTFTAADGHNPITVKAGANVSFNDNMYVGAYVTYDVVAEHADQAYGIKTTFGVQF